ncbi:MAG TPA: hypothetical protein PLZ12_21615 [Saprospiraceae bacterium]|nr:hypothetical protein [Saprospiraceae bacterium]
MNPRNLSSILIFSRIAAGLILLLPILLVLGRVSSCMKTRHNIASASVAPSKYQRDAIVYIGGNSLYVGGAIYIYYEDGKQKVADKSLAKMAEELSFHHINNYTIVNPEKGCYHKASDGLPYWKTSLGSFGISRHYFDRNFRKFAIQCLQPSEK